MSKVEIVKLMKDTYGDSIEVTFPGINTVSIKAGALIIYKKLS